MSNVRFASRVYGRRQTWRYQEPRRSQPVERHPAEGVVEEVGEPDDLEAVRRRGEQAVQSPRGALTVGQDDEVGALLVDDPRQLRDRSEARLVTGLVVDGSHDGKRQASS